MFDYPALLKILSVPRPNGSKSLVETRQKIGEWLDNAGIPHRLHTFKIYPFLMEAVGGWMIVSQLFLAAAIWRRWGWPALVIALVSLAVILLEAGKGIPIVARLRSGVGENIVVDFSPPHPTQEMVISAHYDSKTELLDHRQRAVLLKLMPVGIVLILLLGILGVVDGIWGHAGAVGQWAYIAGIAVSLPNLALMLTLGANFAFGRLAAQSFGVADNGGSCAVVLDVAQRIVAEEIQLAQTKVTLVLFVGEEIVAQGSHAYVVTRDWPLPTIALNLEMVGQNGDYVIWEKLGGVTGALPTTPYLNEALNLLVQDMTGRPVHFLGEPEGTDTIPFLNAGIPATSLGSNDDSLGGGGVHRPLDNLSRVTPAKLSETATVVSRLLQKYDGNELAR